MSLAEFTFTERVRPIIELGIGDTRVPVGQARWDVVDWDQPEATWAGTERTWFDISCDVRTAHRGVSGGNAPPNGSRRHRRHRRRQCDRLGRPPSGAATGQRTVLTVRPGRAIRFGIDHGRAGRRWLWRGFVDTGRPTYDAVNRTPCVSLHRRPRRSEPGQAAARRRRR